MSDLKGCESRDPELFRIARGETAPLLATRLHVVFCPHCRARVSEFARVSGLLETTFQGMVKPTGIQMIAASPWASVLIVGGVISLGSFGWRYYDARANSLVSPGPVYRTGTYAPVFPMKEKGQTGPRPRIHFYNTREEGAAAVTPASSN